jgi:hypothetical protein
MQGPLALWDVVRSSREERQARLHTLEDLLRRECDHAGRSQLDRERQMVEPAADVGDDSVRLEAGDSRTRPGIEELDGLLLDERRDGVLLLAGHVQGLSAGNHDLHVRAGGYEPGHVRPGVDDMLEVVEEHEHSLVADMPRELALRAEHLRRLLEHERRVAKRSE